MSVLVRQFDRFVSVQIVPASGPGVLVNPYPPGVPLPIPNALRVTATISKSIAGDPNSAQISVYNLGPVQRDRVAGVSRQIYTIGELIPTTGVTRAQANRVLAASGATDPIVITSRDGFATVRMEAGYAGSMSVVFEGVCETATTDYDGIDWVSTVRTSDASIALSRAITDGTPVPAGTTGVAYVQSLCAQMGLSLGPIVSQALVGYAFKRTYVPGLVRCRDELNLLLGALECEWWVDDGTLYVTDFGQPLPIPPLTVVGAPDAIGLRLLDRPRQTEDGGVEIRTLLAPTMQIGRACNLITADVAGAFRVDSLTHTIDNRGGAFETAARLTTLNPLGF